MIYQHKRTGVFLVKQARYCLATTWLQLAYLPSCLATANCFTSNGVLSSQVFFLQNKHDIYLAYYLSKASLATVNCSMRLSPTPHA